MAQPGRQNEAATPAANGWMRPQDALVAALRAGILQDDARNRTINRGASSKARIGVMGIGGHLCSKLLSVTCDMILIGVLAGRPQNLMMRQLTLPIVIEEDVDGYFASCPTLQWCYSQGDTYEEVVANIKDAIRLHIDDRKADGDEPNQPKC